jgi:hypothetical protein
MNKEYTTVKLKKAYLEELDRIGKEMKSKTGHNASREEIIKYLINDKKIPMERDK